MGGYIHQQLLLGTGRTHHELVQSTDCILRQLTLRAEHASIQSSQVEGRIHRELLQMAGNVHFQLLMASSPPATRQHDVSRDVSPSATADDGPQEVTSQQGAPSQQGGEGHRGAQEGRQEE